MKLAQSSVKSKFKLLIYELLSVLVDSKVPYFADFPAIETEDFDLKDSET